MMKNFPDIELSFGKAPASTGVFEKEVFIGKSQPGRMHVRFFVTTAAAGGTSLTFKLQGKNEGGSYTDVAASPAVVTAKLTEGAEVVLEIPENWNYEYMKAVATPAGSFSAGEVSAWIDTYLGR